MFAGRPRDITEENMQSRIRGTILMSISNKFGSMVVTTGNKSEMSVGYCTLYGDMNGGYNPIKDVYKTQVYRMAALRNGWRPSDARGPSGDRHTADHHHQGTRRRNCARTRRIRIRCRPTRSLDDILDCLVEGEMRVAAIVARGHDEATVRRVEQLLYLAEYKRRQAAPGVKVTQKYFGRDRRYPITNRFRDPGGPPFSPTGPCTGPPGRAARISSISEVANASARPPFSPRSLSSPAVVYSVKSKR